MTMELPSLVSKGDNFNNFTIDYYMDFQIIVLMPLIIV